MKQRRYSWLRNSSYYLFLLLLASFGPIFNSRPSWLATDLALGLLIASALSLVPPLHTLHAKVTSQHLRAATTQPVSLSLTGRSYLLNLTIFQQKERVWQGSHWRRPVTFTWTNTLPRGRYNELPLALQASDLFGGARKCHPLTLATPLLVGPASESELSQQLLSGLADFVHQASTADVNPSFDLAALRDYRPGNPVHTIDWKISAKRGRTTIRQDRPEQKSQWTGVLLLEQGSAFEPLLGAFTTLTQATKLWTTTFYLGSETYQEPTWDQLATMTAQPAPQSEQSPVPTALVTEPALIIFTAGTTTFPQAQARFPQAKIILVQVTAATVNITSEHDQAQLPREAN